MAADPSIVAQAREWIDRVDSGRGLSNNWRLQVIQKRYRKRDADQNTACNGESCEGLPIRIRRFVPGCPWALVDQAIRYLICKAPYEGLIYNGLEIPGKYRPTITMWQRDESSTVDEQRPQNGTYTLVQDLIEEGCDDKETVVTGETCSYVETTEYHWSDAVPGNLPGCATGCDRAGCQGVTYSVRTKRNDDGTFDWQLVKRVARTQHSGPIDVECNSCTGRVTQEIWDNVYGSPGAFTYDGDCKSPVSVPTCDSVPGVKTQIQIQENPDCTFRITVNRRYASEYSDTWKDGTSCQVRTVTDAHNLRTKPAAMSASVGETVRVQLKRNDDCTYDVQTEVTAAPSEFRKVWTEGSECRLRTVTKIQNSRSEPVVPRPSDGRTVNASVSRNSDCTYDAQITVTEPSDGYTVEYSSGSACTSVREVASRNAATPLRIPVPSVGQVVSANITRNDDCTYDSRYSVTTSSPKSMHWTEGSSCRKVDAYHNVNQTSYSVPRPGPGQSVSASVQRNQDCTYDVSYKITNPYTGDSVTWDDGPACKRRHHTQWIDQPTKPSVHVAAAGETVQANLSFDPGNCTWSGQQTVQDAFKANESFTWSDGSNCQRRRHTLYVDNPVKPVIPSVSDGGTVQASLNFSEQNCTWSGQVTVTDPVSPDNMSWTEGTACNPVQVVHMSASKDKNVPVRPSDNTKVSANVTRNSDCTYDMTYRVEHASPTDSGWVTWDSETKTPGGGYAKYQNGTRVFRNLSSVPTPPTGTNASVSVRVNEFCKYDGEITYSNLVEWVKPGSSSGGGIRNGEFTVKDVMLSPGGRPVTRVGTYDVIAFIGSGNEGTEAEFLLRGYVSMGGGNGVRAYRSPEPKSTSFTSFT